MLGFWYLFLLLKLTAVLGFHFKDRTPDISKLFAALYLKCWDSSRLGDGVTRAVRNMLPMWVGTHEYVFC